MAKAIGPTKVAARTVKQGDEVWLGGWRTVADVDHYDSLIGHPHVRVELTFTDGAFLDTEAFDDVTRRRVARRLVGDVTKVVDLVERRAS